MNSPDLLLEVAQMAAAERGAGRVRVRAREGDEVRPVQQHCHRRPAGVGGQQLRVDAAYEGWGGGGGGVAGGGGGGWGGGGAGGGGGGVAGLWAGSPPPFKQTLNEKDPACIVADSLCVDTGGGSKVTQVKNHRLRSSGAVSQTESMQRRCCF